MGLATVKAYAEDLRSLLGEADFVGRKAFLRSFIKRIEVNGTQVKLQYNLPLPRRGKPREEIEVLPIDTLGGPSDPIAQPKIETFFELSVVPSLPLKEIRS